MTRRLQLRLYRSPVGLYLTVHGSLDADTAQEFGDAVGLALDRCDAGRLTVDLADVDAVDIAGIAMLTLCRATALRRGITLSLTAARVSVRDAIHTARADALLAPAAAPAEPVAGQPRSSRGRYVRAGIRCLRQPAPPRRAAPGSPRSVP
ncbi:hypothetical protein Cme02nite_19250 [Catellatospora methionotrophica]|uniref:STAS domain-containing protein n=1 Tax=Catellatospora methionotrophica TaxID=121620 RepID=A0A8J3PER0_9ACTN|nr:STAS domain-containing protein [Catellatospora methionotrophica]GIG13593.1 hypothetical protein Cme02nite_19250 [Catellatospora methionotrophica]